VNKNKLKAKSVSSDGKALKWIKESAKALENQRP
jgi:hypothetical protein